MAYASPNSWVVKTSKKLSYELRHNSNRNLGRLNDAQFEHLPMLQAFQWAPVKILAFLLSNSNSQFAIHLQLRELIYERIEHWDIYISLSAFQGHTRYSDVASEESLPHGPREGVPLHEEPELGLNQCEWSSAVSHARRTVADSPGNSLRVCRRRGRATGWYCRPVRAACFTGSFTTTATSST